MESLATFGIALDSTSHGHFCSLIFQDAFSRQPRRIRKSGRASFLLQVQKPEWPLLLNFSYSLPHYPSFQPHKRPPLFWKKQVKNLVMARMREGGECIWESNWIHLVLSLPLVTSTGVNHQGWGVSKHPHPHRVQNRGSLTSWGGV